MVFKDASERIEITTPFGNISERISDAPESADPDPVDNSMNVDEVESSCRNSEEPIVDSTRSAALFVLKAQ